MEMEDIETMDIQKIKEVLKFLVTQEKIRQEEIAALKDMIMGVDGYCKEYVDGENYNKFAEKYGEKLEPYSSTFKATEGEDFDMTRAAYDGYKELGDESVSQDEYIEAVVTEADRFVSNLKSSLGLPEEAAVEVTDDGNGNIEVKADTDGDGTTEPVTEEAAEEKTAVEPAEEEIDQKSIDEAVDNYNPRR